MVVLRTDMDLQFLLLVLPVMAVKLRYGAMDLEGPAEEVATLLGKLGYGPFPARSLFPVTSRKALTSANDSTGITYRVPELAEIVQYVREHPTSRPIDVVRATYGDQVRSSGPTRAAYIKALRQVKRAWIELGIFDARRPRTTSSVQSDPERREEEGDRPPAA